LNRDSPGSSLPRGGSPSIAIERVGKMAQSASAPGTQHTILGSAGQFFVEDSYNGDALGQRQFIHAMFGIAA